MFILLYSALNFYFLGLLIFLEFSLFFYSLYFSTRISYPFCFLLFSVILLKHHDQHNLYKEEFILGLDK